MSEISLSKSIADATKFLSKIHSDICALIKSLDDLMDKAGWVSEYDSPCNELDNRLGRVWVLSHLYRLYLRRGSNDEKVERLIVVVFNLKPPDRSQHDFAAVLSAAARFPLPLPIDTINKKWKTTGPSYQATLGKVGPTHLTHDQFKDLFPAASEVVASALPLCDLNSMDAVVKFVTPILDAEDKLSSSSPEFSQLLTGLNTSLGTTWQESDVPTLPPSPLGWEAAREVLEEWAAKSKTIWKQWSATARGLLERWWALKK